MAYAAIRRISPAGGGGDGMAMWATKIALVVAGIASVAGAARLAVPQLAAATAAAIPRLVAAAQVWLAPPYLFFTVHVIILVIWKLSDHKHIKDQWAHPSPPPPPPSAGDEHVKPYSTGTTPLVRKPTPEISPVSGDLPPAPASLESSCVTTESDEDSASSAKRSAVPAPEVESVRLEDEAVVAAVAAEEEMAIENEDDDSMDATWKAIMKKTSRTPAVTPPARAREESAGADEMNRRFDDFIKKSRDQIRLQMERAKY